MKKDLRLKQVSKMIQAGIENLFQSQDTLNLDQFAVITLEALMLLEREEYLKSINGVKDIGNGTYLRDFKSLGKNSLKINIPRTRNGEFKPMILSLISQQKEQLNELALLLYRKGLSSRDVSYVLEEYFGESMSKETVNNLADSFHSIRQEWLNKQLDAYYKVVYCDALFVSLKRGNSYSKEAVYVMFGVKDDNTRELLTLEVNPTESSNMWSEYCEKLKKRGVEQIDLFVADGLTGFADAIRRYYPENDIQRCVVHLQRSILNKIRPRDKAAFSYDLKEVFNNFDKYSTRQQAMEKIKYLVNTWRDSYPTINRLLEDTFLTDYLTYIEYPVSIRRMIYTKNSIENLNRQIRKVTKTKVNFDREDNLLGLIFMIIKDFEMNNWQKYPVIAFQQWPKKTQ